jgi:Arc/MetJ-type ribon-helix-helix transcriptional regulator
MGYDSFIPREVNRMATAVKRTISLPSDLAKEVEEMAREEGKPVSAVIQDALRLAKRERLKKGGFGEALDPPPGKPQGYHDKLPFPRCFRGNTA